MSSFVIVASGSAFILFFFLKKILLIIKEKRIDVIDVTFFYTSILRVYDLWTCVSICFV